MRIAPLPYQPDSALLFEAIADEPWAMFLDSGRPAARGGRWDILVARPAAVLVTRGGETVVQERAGQWQSRAEPLTVLRQRLGPPSGPANPDIPFAGGALGYFAYDLGRRYLGLPDRADPDPLPDMAVGIYDWAVLVDHERRQSHLVSPQRDPATAAAWPELLDLFSRPPEARARLPFQARGPMTAGFSRAAYERAFARIQAYIRAGDCYQVNLAQSYAVPVTGDHWLAYRRLRLDNPAPYGAYLNLPFAQVLCCSPERYLTVRDGMVETRPIKGTRPRATDPGRDAALAAELAGSPKDKAENLMIVDLLRNDLGRVCATGTVRVPELFAVESFAHVHHLVSTVRGVLAPGADALDLLRAAFPGGSITGAPKRRAMEIIDELEPVRRGVYCGSIGYIGHDGGMDSNIVIRTLVSSGGSIRYWAGGGLVADSNAAAEYRECQDKGAPLAALLRAAGAELPDSA